MHTFTVSTSKRLAVIDITETVKKQLPADANGTVTLFVTHTTAGVTVNEAESRLLSDFETALSEFVDDSGWEHDQLDGNADSHIRSLLIGPSVTIPVVDGELQLGAWQSVLFVECDGPRERTVQIVS